MEFLKLWILKLTLTIKYEKMAMHSLISNIKSQFPEAKGVKERWKLGLSDEEMVDIAQHHLKLPNFRGVIPKDHLPLFTQYVIQEKPREQITVIINTARDSEPGKHWICLHYQPPLDFRACQEGCLVEYFDSYGVANLLPEINNFIEEISPFNPVGYNFVNLQDFSDDQSVACGYHCLYFAFMKHKKPELCVTDFYKAYPNDGRDQHENDLHVIHFMEHHLCVNNK